MSSSNPDPDWQEDSVIAGELEDRELDLEEAQAKEKIFERIIDKKQGRIEQLEQQIQLLVQLLGDAYHANKDAQ